MTKFVNGVILCTALPPTTGHQALIEFAHAHLTSMDDEASLYVIVSTRSHEPLLDRVTAIGEQFPNRAIRVVEHADDNAPQAPNGPDDAQFWDYWRATIRALTNADTISHVYASEPYGVNVAATIGAKFIPFDINRDINPIRGTVVRANLYENFHNLMPSMQKKVQVVATIFGADSVGKSTLAKALAMIDGESVFIPEWARTFLETHHDGVGVTEEKMLDIVHGQYASQVMARNLPKRLVIQDTDLLTTIGYYQIFGYPVPPVLIERFAETRSDIYLLCQSNIPYEGDPLRYGDGVRESTDQFWIDLLNQYSCNFEVINAHSLSDRMEEAAAHINTYANVRDCSLREFIRET